MCYHLEDDDTAPLPLNSLYHLQISAKGSFINCLDLYHTHSLVSIQLSGLSDQQMLLLAKSSLWCPNGALTRAEEWFLWLFLLKRREAAQSVPSLVPEVTKPGVTSPNPSENVKQPMKSQSSIYWNSMEARTSTSILPLTVILWNSLFTPTIPWLQYFHRPKDSDLWPQIPFLCVNWVGSGHETSQYILTKAFLLTVKMAAMCTACCDYACPPPPTPPFLLGQNLKTDCTNW